jgi:probable phosphoglycerate mutase
MYNMNMSYGKLYLVRHGETLWSKSGQYTGRTDLDLTPPGVEQAKLLAPFIAKLNVSPQNTYVSPLRRAQQTATYAGVKEFNTSELVAEWAYGTVEGHSVSEVTGLLGRVWDIFTDGISFDTSSLPNVPTPYDSDGNPISVVEFPGETIGEVSARTKNFIAHVTPALERGEDVLCVSHAHILRVLALDFLELDPALGSKLRLSNCSISKLSEVNGQRTILKWNETPWQK